MKRELQIVVIFFFTVCSLIITHSCKESLSLPVLETQNVSGISQTTATIASDVTDDGGSIVFSRGICWAKDRDQVISNSISAQSVGRGEFITILTGLSPNTTYYVRAYAVNRVGINYGNIISFTTSPEQIELTTLTTSDVTYISSISAVSGGIVTRNSNGDLIDWGICWSTLPNPTVSDGHSEKSGGEQAQNKNFISYMTGLSPATKYYVRAFATIEVGTAYGNEVSFTTNSPTIVQNFETMEDIEGNVYKTITIGTQTWMAENLKTTKYNDNTPILNVTDDAAWKSAPGAYCWYVNDSSTYGNVYGALYNWNAISTGKLCPAGWRVPSNDDWTVLSTYLGGWPIAGAKLKETGTSHWVSPNVEATNEYGFTALPGGMRSVDWNNVVKFEGLETTGIWWSSTFDGDWSDNSLMLNVGSYSFNSYPYNFKQSSGLSVRCVK